MQSKLTQGNSPGHILQVMCFFLVLSFFSSIARAVTTNRVELSVRNIEKVETTFDETSIRLCIDGRYAGTSKVVGKEIVNQVTGNKLCLFFNRGEETEALSCGAMARRGLENEKLSLTLIYYSERHDSANLSVTGVGYTCGLAKFLN